MKNKIIILSCLIFFVALFAFPASTWAGFSYTPMENIPGFSNSGDFPTYIQNIYKFGIWAIGIAALLMVSVGGFMYITSAGNQASMGKAKGIIQDAIIGLIMALTAWIILNEINPGLVKVTITPPPALTGTSSTTGTSASTSTTSSADQIAQDLATCNSGCDQAGGDTTTCKQGCTDTANAATKAAAASSTSSTSKDTRSADQIASDCSSWCTNGGYGGGETTDQCNSKCVSDTTASQKAQTASNSTNTSGTSVSSSNCSQINDACNNNSSGVDPKLVKAMLTGGEGCNKSVSSDGYGSCGYSQALPAIRTKCGISGTAAESCAAIQNDAQLDANCAAWLINDNAKRCGTDVSGAASCYNSGKANNCANTTKNYCGRVQDAYNKL